MARLKCVLNARRKNTFSIFILRLGQKKNGIKRPDIQSQCSACRIEQRKRKYNSDPHSYVFRLIQLILQPSAQRKGRKPCSMKLEGFMNEWQKQYEKTGTICPKLGIQMTYTGGENKVRTNISIDRIDGKKDYERDNVQFVSHIYNIMKQNYTDKEVDEICLLRSSIIKKELENGQEKVVGG